MMSDDSNYVTLESALSAVIDAQNVKITRIMRVNRLMERVIRLDMDIAQAILSMHSVSPELSEQLLKWAKRHDDLREELSESVKESVEAEENLVEVYQSALDAIWNKSHGE